MWTNMLMLAAVQAGNADAPPIASVTIHPFVAATFMCSEHAEGTLKGKGDALGSDCTVMGGLDEKVQPLEGFLRPYRSNGRTNEDWYGWNEPVLAPFDGTVEKVRINPVSNVPGTLGTPPASFIIFARADGTKVLYAHVQAVTVKEGDTVEAGQPVARVGNNGMAWAPHIHIGAWKGEQPMQIGFDLRAMGRIRAAGE